MTRQLINSERLHHDVPYHYAAAATGETLVFTAGACPLDADGRVVAPGDIPSQTRQALENLQIAVDEADCEQRDVVKTTVFVASSSRDDLLQAWNEYEGLCGADRPPSTLLEKAEARNDRDDAVEVGVCQSDLIGSGVECGDGR